MNEMVFVFGAIQCDVMSFASVPSCVRLYPIHVRVAMEAELREAGAASPNLVIFLT